MWLTMCVEKLFKIIINGRGERHWKGGKFYSLRLRTTVDVGGCGIVLYLDYSDGCRN